MRPASEMSRVSTSMPVPAVNVRMTGRNPRHSACGIRHRRTAAGNASRRLAQWRKNQVVGIFLAPGQPTFITIDAKTEIILVTRRHLTGPEHSFRTIRKAQHKTGVVIQPPPFNK